MGVGNAETICHRLLDMATAENIEGDLQATIAIFTQDPLDSYPGATATKLPLLKEKTPG